MALQSMIMSNIYTNFSILVNLYSYYSSSHFESPCQLRTFLIRNGLPVLFKEGQSAYKAYYLR